MNRAKSISVVKNDVGDSVTVTIKTEITMTRDEIKLHQGERVESYNDAISYVIGNVEGGNGTASYCDDNGDEYYNSFYEVVDKIERIM